MSASREFGPPHQDRLASVGARELPEEGHPELGRQLLRATLADNRCTFHRGRSWHGTGYRRVMHRTTVASDGRTVPD